MMYSGCVCFFFKKKTAYDMRIIDWSSDVCSSDLLRLPATFRRQAFCFQASGLRRITPQQDGGSLGWAQHSFGGCELSGGRFIFRKAGGVGGRPGAYGRPLFGAETCGPQFGRPALQAEVQRHGQGGVRTVSTRWVSEEKTKKKNK